MYINVFVYVFVCEYMLMCITFVYIYLCVCLGVFSKVVLWLKEFLLGRTQKMSGVVGGSFCNGI